MPDTFYPLVLLFVFCYLPLALAAEGPDTLSPEARAVVCASVGDYETTLENAASFIADPAAREAAAREAVLFCNAY